MTRLDAMRALLALPETDGYQRQRGVKTLLPADRKALQMSNPRAEAQKPKTARPSRMAFVHAVHLGKGA
jgi:hypothetical protein